MAEYISYEKCVQAYRNDPYFHAIVENMVNLIATMSVTPSEIRCIATFAATLFEEQNRFSGIRIPASE